MNRTLLRRRSSLIGLVVGVPLSAVFLWLAVRNADLGEVWAALSGAEIAPVVLAALVLGCVYTTQALRWRSVAGTPWVSRRRFAEMVVSGLAVNNVLPGRVGDLLRARWLQVAARIPAGRALASVFVDRTFDVVALVAFLAVSLPFVASAEWLYRIVVGGLALLVAIGVLLVVARVYTRRRPRERRSGRGFFRRVARDTVEGLANPLGFVRAGSLAALSLGIWAMWGLAAWLVARAVGIELSLVESLFVTGVINLGVAIPSSPGFIGTYQWLGVSALALFEVPTEAALAFTVLLQAVWYVPTLVVGGALLARRALGSVRTASLDRVPVAESRNG